MKKLTFYFCIPILLNLSSGCSYLPPILLLMRDPLTAEEHNNLGVAYEKEGKFELAIKEYKKALKKNNKLATPLVNIGNTYLKQQDYSSAEKYYLRALRKEEYNMEAANNLASLYIVLGKDYKKGLSLLTRAVVYNEGFPAYAMDTMGVLNTRIGKMEKAEFYLTRACENAENDAALIDEIDNHLLEIGQRRCKF